MNMPYMAIHNTGDMAVHENDRPHGKYLLSLSVAIVLLLALAALWFKLLQPNILPIQHVKIEGQFLHLKPEKLKTLSARIVSGGFFNVNVSIIKETLLKEPWVRSVTVRRSWPDTLVLYVDEQSPVSTWNSHQLINEAGVLFAPEASSIPAGLPALSGPKGTHLELLALLNYLNDRLRAHKMQVIQLAMDARRSLSFTLHNGTVLKIGNENIEGRIARFLRYVPAQININRAAVSAIDMRYPNGFSVQPNAVDELAGRE